MANPTRTSRKPRPITPKPDTLTVLLRSLVNDPDPAVRQWAERLLRADDAAKRKEARA